MGQATTNVATWRAGQSCWRGKSSVNGFSIDIEIINPGIMQLTPAGNTRAWFGRTFDTGKFGIEARRTREQGNGLWLPYTSEQIDAVIGICGTLVAAYRTTVEITMHWSISVSRKVYTNSVLPLDQVRVLGRADASAEDGADAATTVGVNMRRWPGNIRDLENVVHNAVLLGRRPRTELDVLRLTRSLRPVAEGPAGLEDALRALFERALVDRAGLV